MSDNDAPVSTDVYPAPGDAPGDAHRAPDSSRGPASPLRIPVGDAMRRYWLIVLLPTLLLLGTGIYFGVTRAPRYTSEARLTVGRVDVDPASLATFASATQALASAYSRAVEAQSVVLPVARRLRMTPAQVRREISASPVPDSPVIRVKATTGSKARAVALANVASGALVAYTTTLNRTSADSSRLLDEYRAVSLRVSQDQRRLNALGVDAPKARAAAQAELAADSLQARSLASAFQTSQQGIGASKLVGVLTEATGASSDRTPKLQLLGFAGALAGLLLGLAAASLLANRRARRSMIE
jgi:capsular polysaccharide biosynthesis protein